MNETLRSELVGTSALTLAAVAAGLLTIARNPDSSRAEERARVTRLFLVGLGFQCLHFAEEYFTRFYDRFPVLLGLTAWSPTFFVVFNVSWLVVWALAAAGLRAGYRPALFPVWFFAIAMMANGIAHPLLSVRVRGYFSGLFTSPLVGVVGLRLWSRLMALTQARDHGGYV